MKSACWKHEPKSELFGRSISKIIQASDLAMLGYSQRGCGSINSSLLADASSTSSSNGRRSKDSQAPSPINSVSNNSATNTLAFDGMSNPTTKSVERFGTTLILSLNPLFFMIRTAHLAIGGKDSQAVTILPNCYFEYSSFILRFFPTLSTVNAETLSTLPLSFVKYRGKINPSAVIPTLPEYFVIITL
ncbi:hypothetical protein KSF78_0003586 [Schistosoma japonicum]|nr:hypothetical protein KSF78_0003586 [Schistosoma japonicum]